MNEEPDALEHCRADLLQEMYANQRLRALVSWIEGALVDEMPWMEIREQITAALDGES